MRADRLVSLVLLLRQRGRLTADALAAELEVSTRTVMRDIEALSAAGVPVYAERGRHGGYALLPGFRTELTGLTDDEAVAVLAAGSAHVDPALGLGSSLASALRKVVDAMPESSRATAKGAAQRLLSDPGPDLLPRRAPEAVSGATMREVRGAVLAGRRLRIRYTAVGQSPRWRTVDPLGLVTVRGRAYLLATRAGADRTYRMSRLEAAEALPEPAQRPLQVDLDQLWAERCAQFLSEGHVLVSVHVAPGRREQLLDMAEALRSEEEGPEGWSRVEVAFQDLWHAEWALWQLGAGAEALSPPALRSALHERAAHLADRYRGSSRVT